MMNGRSALPPSSLCARSQYTPGTASFATVTLSLPFSFAASTDTPRPLAHTFTGQVSNVPVAVTSAVVPRCAPAGWREVTVGGAAKEEEAVATKKHRRHKKEDC